jgi:hypothetical protein
MLIQILSAKVYHPYFDRANVLLTLISGIQLVEYGQIMLHPAK